MTSKELIKKIRRIEIISNKLAEEIFSGEYRSGFLLKHRPRCWRFAAKYS